MLFRSPLSAQDCACVGLEVDRFRTRNNGYKGAWLTIGKEERIHLIELRNSFKHEQRDEAGMNVDFAFAIPPGSVERLMARMDVHGTPALSSSGSFIFQEYYM